MYEEMMMNNDNLGSNLLTSSLLKLRSLYKFCRVTSCTYRAGDLDGLNCVIPASMKCVIQVLSVVKVWNLRHQAPPQWWFAVKTTKSLNALFRLVLFLLSCGWLAKCLVLTAAQFSLFSACAVT